MADGLRLTPPRQFTEFKASELTGINLMSVATTTHNIDVSGFRQFGLAIQMTVTGSNPTAGAYTVKLHQKDSAGVNLSSQVTMFTVVDNAAQTAAASPHVALATWPNPFDTSAGLTAGITIDASQATTDILAISKLLEVEVDVTEAYATSTTVTLDVTLLAHPA